MSEIFISYKREEQDKARQLADALEREGWTVWWDPKLRAGEHFDEVIEAALKEAKCAVVLWSSLSVNSRWIRDEAAYALDQHKLVPVIIEDVNLPLSFRRIHTPRLIDWDGSGESPEFQVLIRDIEQIVGPKENHPKEIGVSERVQDGEATAAISESGVTVNVEPEHSLPSALTWREQDKSPTTTPRNLSLLWTAPVLVVETLRDHPGAIGKYFLASGGGAILALIWIALINSELRVGSDFSATEWMTVWSISGLFLGGAQYLAYRRHLQLPWTWWLTTSVGHGMGGVLLCWLVLLVYTLTPGYRYEHNYAGAFIWAPALGAPIAALMQAYFLRFSRKMSILWFWANLWPWCAWFAAMLLLWSPREIGKPDDEVLTGALVFLLPLWIASMGAVFIEAINSKAIESR